MCTKNCTEHLTCIVMLQTVAAIIMLAGVSDFAFLSLSFPFCNRVITAVHGTVSVRILHC